MTKASARCSLGMIEITGTVDPVVGVYVPGSEAELIATMETYERIGLTTVPEYGLFAARLAGLIADERVAA